MSKLRKRFDLDEGKARARKRLRTFIKGRIYNRKKANVLCLPGEYGLEIESVYRKLGFRDCNIFGVERDVKAAKAIEERYPDICVYHGTLVEFATSYEGPPFSVISLDYCGKLTLDKFSPLYALSALGHIAERCVIHVNVMAGRERPSVQSDIRSLYGRVLQDRKGLPGKLIEMSEAKNLLREISEEELFKARDDALTEALMAPLSFLVPSMRVCAGWDLSRVEGASYAIGPDAELTEREDGSTVIEGATPISTRDPLNRSKQVKHEAILQVNEELEKAGVIDAAKAFDRRTGQYLPDRFYEYHVGRALVMHFFDRYGNPDFVVDVDRFSYVSESGRRMLTDIIETRRMEKELEAIPTGIAPFTPRGDPEAHRFLLKPHPCEFESMDAYLKFLHKVVKSYAKRIASRLKTEPETWPEREDLGGGTVVMTEDQMKEKVVRLIKAGRDNEYILRKFPTFKKGSIAAIRAHVTMGTY